MKPTRNPNPQALKELGFQSLKRPLKLPVFNASISRLSQELSWQLRPAPQHFLAAKRTARSHPQPTVRNAAAPGMGSEGLACRRVDAETRGCFVAGCRGLDAVQMQVPRCQKHDVSVCNMFRRVICVCVCQPLFHRELTYLLRLWAHGWHGPTKTHP